MRYWWVNHKQTAVQETTGGYLWSPMRETHGARSQFYENMRIAKQGDLILSYANTLIGHIGVVQDFASVASKPAAFGGTGDYWNDEGWLLPVAWTQLSNPVRPKSHIENLAPLLPSKYSPLNPTSGNGNQKAYLAEISERVVELLIDPSLLATKTHWDDSLSTSPLIHLEDSIEKRIAGSSLDETVKAQIILARRGQGLFRSRVAAVEKACRLTAISDPRLLVASHIKPWRACVTADERLDGSNGLLLTPHVDRLFDRGLVSFKKDGEVIVSQHLNECDINKLGLSQTLFTNCGGFTEQQDHFLTYHRDTVFLR